MALSPLEMSCVENKVRVIDRALQKKKAADEFKKNANQNPTSPDCEGDGFAADAALCFLLLMVTIGLCLFKNGL